MHHLRGVYPQFKKVFRFSANEIHTACAQRFICNILSGKKENITAKYNPSGCCRRDSKVLLPLLLFAIGFSGFRLGCRFIVYMTCPLNRFNTRRWITVTYRATGCLRSIYRRPLRWCIGRSRSRCRLIMIIFI